ncbi:DNA-binding response regulator [Mucilaginibacter sp. PPCGB 2223]|nr:DNA-binding response regulator [Mucilaginibacter sp. PPCGB 2223]
MRCLILDDEPLSLEVLEDNIKRTGLFEVAERCSAPAQAMLALQHEQIDLLFCDIQMPGINGLQLVRSLKNGPPVIFITAYQEFALQGYELDVIDYLLKPVEIERFLQACQKAVRHIERGQRRHQRDYFFLHVDYTLVKVPFNDIIYIEGLKDYVKVYLDSQSKPLLSRITFKALEEQLPGERFFRVHKSYIVNIDQVQSIRKGRIKTVQAEIPCSDNYKEIVGQMTGRC